MTAHDSASLELTIVKPEQPVILNSLPYETLERIFHFLSEADLLRLTRASKALRAVALDYLGQRRRSLAYYVPILAQDPKQATQGGTAPLRRLFDNLFNYRARAQERHRVLTAYGSFLAQNLRSPAGLLARLQHPQDWQTAHLEIIQCISDHHQLMFPKTHNFLTLVMDILQSLRERSIDPKFTPHLQQTVRQQIVQFVMLVSGKLFNTAQQQLLWILENIQYLPQPLPVKYLDILKNAFKQLNPERQWPLFIRFAHLLDFATAVDMARKLLPPTLKLIERLGKQGLLHGLMKLPIILRLKQLISLCYCRHYAA